MLMRGTIIPIRTGYGHVPKATPNDMLYKLTFSVDGFEGLPEEQIRLLERKIQEEFYNWPGRLNGRIIIYADMLGDIGLQVAKIHMFMFRIRALVSPALNFHIDLDFSSDFCR